MAYSATYTNDADDYTVTSSSEPFAFDPATSTYIISTTDEDYKDKTHAFTVFADFANFPSSTTTADSYSAAGSVTYTSGCKSPSFTGTWTITDPASVPYTDTPVSATVPEYATVPAYCTVTYTCESVVGSIT